MRGQKPSSRHKKQRFCRKGCVDSDGQPASKGPNCPHKKGGDKQLSGASATTVPPVPTEAPPLFLPDAAGGGLPEGLPRFSSIATSLPTDSIVVSLDTDNQAPAASTLEHLQLHDWESMFADSFSEIQQSNNGFSSTSSAASSTSDFDFSGLDDFLGLGTSFSSEDIVSELRLGTGLISANLPDIHPLLANVGISENDNEVASNLIAANVLSLSSSLDQNGTSTTASSDTRLTLAPPSDPPVPVQQGSKALKTSSKRKRRGGSNDNSDVDESDNDSDLSYIEDDLARSKRHSERCLRIKNSLKKLDARCRPYIFFYAARPESILVRNGRAQIFMSQAMRDAIGDNADDFGRDLHAKAATHAKTFSSSHDAVAALNRQVQSALEDKRKSEHRAAVLQKERDELRAELDATRTKSASTGNV
ncbi:hypothetical protein H0H92_005743 [Tricholoma furcatifolium]|nr:hypothetical protein H0H92_005743 [Tricholoma furcatifolium]